jgi:hypothetical protein
MPPRHNILDVANTQREGKKTLFGIFLPVIFCFCPRAALSDFSSTVAESASRNGHTCSDALMARTPNG